MILLAVLAGGLILPHLWPQRWLTPVGGVALWTAALSLRALLALLAVLLFVLYLPATQLFHLVTQWCLHAVLPFLAVHLGLSGHSLGDAAVLIPAMAIAFSVLSAIFAAWRAARAVARWARSSSLGRGPRESVVVGGPEILVAAAGLRRPRVVVSTGALTSLDDDELAAGLEHEWGHIHRRHRYLALLGQMLFALARLVPGANRALGELHLHLERDADEYVVRRTGDPLALASAICKSALTRSLESQPALATLGGSAGQARLEPLLHRSKRPGWPARLATLALLVALLCLSLGLALSAPVMASVGPEQATASPPALLATCS
jgi:Zn-dependent protease with chaperone function